MAAKLSIDILSDFNNRGIREAESSMGRLGSAGSRLGGLLKGAAVTGAAAAGAAVVAFGVKAVNAASDLQQSFGAIESTFSGRGLKAIQDFGKTSATSVGLATSEFNQLAAVTGSMLQNLGYNSTQAADATTTLATRAADLAATFNTDTSTALDAMNAALRGEMDPLEQFGIKLSAADIKAKEAAMGLDTGTAAAKKHADAQAALALIMEQSASKAGTFAEETGTMAGGMQVLGAQFTNIAAQIGTAFMPIIQQVLALIQANVVPAVQKFADWISKLGAGFTTSGAAVGPFQAILTSAKQAFNTIWPVIQKVIGVMVSMAKTIGTALQPVVKAIASFISGTFLPTLKGIWSTIGAQLVPAWNKLINALRPVLNVIGQVAAKLMGPLSQAFRIVGGAVQVVITIISKIISVMSTLISAVSRVSGAVSGAFSSAWRSASSAMGSVIGIINNVIAAIQRAISAVQNFFSSGIGKIGSAIGGLFGRSATTRSMGRAAAGRAAPTGRASGGSITVNGAANPQVLARDLSRILTGAQVRTGYTGVRI